MDTIELYDIVYVDMVGDLFHCGHVAYLKECKKMARILKVGVHSDEVVRSYKRIPVMTMEERIKVIGACRYVDEVIPNAPLTVTPEFLTEHNIQKVVYANNPDSPSDINKMYAHIIDKVTFIPYTSGISTTLIIKRIKNREDLS